MTGRRVLMTADAVGGVWTYALELARGLTAEGGEVLLAVIGPPPGADQQAEAAAVPGLRLAVTGLALEWQDRAGLLDPDACGRLLALERSFRPDLVHCNGFREAAAGFAAPVVLVAHSCVGTWWLACRGETLPGEWHRYAEAVRAGLAAADAVVAPTAAFLDQIVALWGPLDHARVIHNGLDLDPPAAPCRRPFILAAGRLWDEAKNIRTLAATAPALPWPVLLAGEPPAAGLGETVRCLGRLPAAELHALMAEAAIFALPARYEPFGLAALEAARCGCALVLGTLPGLRELWSDAACFVPPGDAAALGATLRHLIEDEPARARLQAAAQARSQAFRRRPMLDRYLALYAGLPAGRTRRRERAA